MKGKTYSLLLMGVIGWSAQATELIYTPVNPNFGGNPLNGNFLLGVANAINDHKDPTSSDPFEQQSDLERLTANLESRLISQLLADVGNGNTGQLSTDDFLLNIVDDNGVLLIQITDKQTGESSTIQVNGLMPD
ncbi:curli production assembly protein CsgF [Photobacterium sp. WH24]|uniref:Curli production assembly/transport component CsgF n=1 Tax=Photobacterium arenosum TaxID=2774143 RepID=A0ABR9BJ46_9GAMM|nr:MULTISPECIES: curli assembly protein CsgF [Photobacterium]MBD8512487.1 curli production assembly protein CsgF [Photobacterium arenosum]MBV7260847.1 curli production assembly protein CsgF [Photobacterium sp. WH24]